VVSYTFGFKFGLFYGMLSILISYIAMRRLSYFILTYVPSYALVALLAASPLKIDIITLGMICTVMYNILSCILVVMFFRAKLYKCIFFAVTNIMFNYFLFTTFGSLIIHLLG